MSFNRTGWHPSPPSPPPLPTDPVRDGYQRARRIGGLLSRIVAAILGGYALAAVTSVAAVALPIARSEAVFTGLLLSFIVYTAVVIWVFAARSALLAWAGLVLAALPMLGAAWPVWTGAIAP